LISSFFHKAFRDISYILGEVTFSRRFLWCFSRPRDTGLFVSLFQINHRSDRDLEPNQQAFTSSHFPILFANSVTMCLSLPDTCRRQCIMVVVMVCLETIWRQMSLLDSSFLLEALYDFHKDVIFRRFLRRLPRPEILVHLYPPSRLTTGLTAIWNRISRHSQCLIFLSFFQTQSRCVYHSMTLVAESASRWRWWSAWKPSAARCNWWTLLFF
jgi:hypothetical protein